jgi:hypothetical protein
MVSPAVSRGQDRARWPRGPSGLSDRRCSFVALAATAMPLLLLGASWPKAKAVDYARLRHQGTRGFVERGRRAAL